MKVPLDINGEGCGVSESERRPYLYGRRSFQLDAVRALAAASALAVAADYQHAT